MSDSSDQLEIARLGLAECGTQGLIFANSISQAQWISRPANGSWSPGECFAHLNLTTTSMLPLLQAAAQEARASGWTARSSSFRVGLLARMLCWFLEPPYRIKMATAPNFVPGEAALKADVLTKWKDKHQELDMFIKQSAGLALDRPAIVSPFDPKGRVRYSAYSALLILASHERRHLWQATRARQQHP